MKRSYALAAALCLMFFSAGVALRTPGSSPRPAGPAVEQDTVSHEQNAQLIEHELGELRAKIAGREKEPAGDVFKNIQLNKAMEAGRLPGMMGFWSNRRGKQIISAGWKSKRRETGNRIRKPAWGRE